MTALSASPVASDAAIDGKPIGLELFDSSTVFARYLEKLMRSYALDAIETAEDRDLFRRAMERAGLLLPRVVDVRLVEAAPVAGALRFELLSEGQVFPRGRKRDSLKAPTNER